MEMKLKDAQVIDCTPTWEGMLPVMLAVIQDNSNAQAVKCIKEEFTRMARIADAYKLMTDRYILCDKDGSELLNNCPGQNLIDLFSTMKYELTEADSKQFLITIAMRELKKAGYKIERIK